jgi:hypothetical protein
MTDGADAIYENNTSFVDGPVSKIGDDAFEFPTGDVVGSTFVWAPIAMADPGSNVTDRFTAEYFLQAAPYNWAAGDMCDVTDLNHVSGEEYWEMTRNSGSTYPNLTLYWKDANRSGITNVSQLCVGHRETCTLGHPGWVRMAGTASGSTGVGGTGSATATGFTSYSPITFGTKNNSNPLPVELLEFSASCDGQKVETRWMTASETNNDYFTLERSADASRWEYVSRIDGAGNSNQPLSYLYYDENPYEGISYYRLKQTDFDGATETFDAIAVACISAESYEISIYPNPFKTEFILKFRNVKADKANIRFFDLLGSQVMEKEVDIKGIDKLTLDMSFLATGVYYLEFKAGDVNFRTKVVKN